MEKEYSVQLEELAAVIPSTGRFWQHARTPCNLGRCAAPSASATGVGSCGDSLCVDLKILENNLEEVKCTPRGCIYTVACASAMSVLASGRSVNDALKLQPEDVVEELEGLPDDHLHCARLAVNTLGEAIAEYYRLRLCPENVSGKD